MSLAIDVDRVTAVLLADGWHQVMWRKGVSTFAIDAYEFLYYGSAERRENHEPVQVNQPAGMTQGFEFTEGTRDGAESGEVGAVLCGSLHHILAVRVAPR